jgi:hypothetical protein
VSEVEIALREMLDKAIETINLLRESARESHGLLGVIAVELGDIEDNLAQLDVETAARRIGRLAEILRDGLLELALIHQ